MSSILKMKGIKKRLVRCNTSKKHDSFKMTWNGIELKKVGSWMMVGLRYGLTLKVKILKTIAA